MRRKTWKKRKKTISVKKKTTLKANVASALEEAKRGNIISDFSRNEAMKRYCGDNKAKMWPWAKQTIFPTIASLAA